MMNKSALLNAIKTSVHTRYPKARLYLYGSRSRGDDKSDSDWDIMIVLNEKISERDKLPLYDELYELSLQSGEIISVIIQTEDEWQHPLMQVSPFYQNVTLEDVLI